MLAETCHLLVTRLGTTAAERLLESGSQGAFELFELRREHLPRVVTLLATYADLPVDLTDASLVILAEELGTGRTLSTDQRDFRAYRWKERKPFQNLLKL